MTMDPRWMPDTIMETPKLGRAWCPGCRPEGDPTREILDVSWCAAHKPSEAGTADAATVPALAPFFAGGSEADGHDNRAMARLLQRRHACCK